MTERSDDTEQPLGLREQKKLASRTAIIDAALELFAERGFDETTVASVASRAGVSPATVARYFPTKESMLFSGRDERIEILRDSIARRPSRETPLVAVTNALQAQPPFVGAAERRLLLTRLAIARSTVLRGRSNNMVEDWRDGIAGALEERGTEPIVAHVVSVVVVAVLDDASERWARGGAAAPLAESVAEAFAVLDRRAPRS